jgi:hypothetical protein
MRGGLQLRGEILHGQPYDGRTTTGWYTDVLLHHMAMGPIMAVGRVERLAYDAAPPFAYTGRRQTVGARVRILEGLSVQASLVHMAGKVAETTSTAVDLGISYSLRTD